MTSEHLNMLDLSWSWGKNLDGFIVGKLNILEKISTYCIRYNEKEF